MVSREVGLAQKLAADLSDKETNVPGEGGAKERVTVDCTLSSLLVCFPLVLSDEALSRTKAGLCCPPWPSWDHSFSGVAEWMVTKHICSALRVLGLQ